MSMVYHRVTDAVTSGRQPEPPDLLAQADAARDAGRFAEAAALFEGHVAAHPDAAGAMVQAGHMRKESGSLEKAEAHYTAALALLPDDFDLHLQLGHFYKVAGRFERAGQFYGRAAELQPGSAEAKAEVSHVAALLAKAATPVPVMRLRTAAEAGAAEFARNVPAARFADVLDDIVAHRHHYLLAGVEQRFPDREIPAEDAVRCVSACLGAGMTQSALAIIDGLCRTVPVPQVPVSLVAQCLRAVLDEDVGHDEPLETIPVAAQAAMLNVATNLITRQKALIDRLL